MKNKISVVLVMMINQFIVEGAEIKDFLTFDHIYKNCKVFVEQNYRSTKNILETASTLISNNSNRVGKLWSSANQGELVESIVKTERKKLKDYLTLWNII